MSPIPRVVEALGLHPTDLAAGDDHGGQGLQRLPRNRIPRPYRHLRGAARSPTASAAAMTVGGERALIEAANQTKRDQHARSPASLPPSTATPPSKRCFGSRATAPGASRSAAPAATARSKRTWPRCPWCGTVVGARSLPHLRPRAGPGVDALPVLQGAERRSRTRSRSLRPRRPSRRVFGWKIRRFGRCRADRRSVAAAYR